GLNSPLAAISATNIPKRSDVLLLNSYRLRGYESDLRSTFQIQKETGNFDEIKSCEDLLRIRIKATDAIRKNFEKKTVILIADLKEFTPRTEEDCVEAAEAVQRLSDILNEEVSKNGGKGTPTEGDSYVASFDQVEEAITTALDTMNRLAEYNNRVEPKRQIMVRIGINSGFAIFMRGQPFIGSVLNLAARAMKEVDPGKICVTRYALKTVKNPKKLRFHTLGLKTLKGIQNPVELYEVERV
ncbi:unnamed protein product, partial [marine sediment metagenome]